MSKMKNIRSLQILMKGVALMIFCFSLMGCASPLMAPSVTRNASLVGYKYVYMTPTSEKTSVTGSAYGYRSGSVYGITSSHSVNPADLICGHFLKRGYTRLPELKSELMDNTIIVNYGETGRRDTGWGSYTIEVTIQIVSAKTSEVICIGTAEGRGSTEADDVRIAIDRCMNVIFNSGN